MSAQFDLTAGDTAPQLSAVLRDAAGELVDLTEADVRFELSQPRGGEIVIDSPMTIVDLADSRIRYEWADGDTDEPGRYRAQFVVTYPHGTVETFPADDAHDVVIH